MEDLSWAAIFARAAQAFWPVWLALVVTFALSISFKRGSAFTAS
jgi:peptide/nickel transport system permease protein